MKLGPLEVIVILIIAGAILLVFRGMTARRTVEPPPPPIRVRRPTSAETEEERIKSGRQKRFRWLGGAFVVIGVLVLISSIEALKFILTGGYALAGLIIFAGVFILFLSARL